MRGTQVLILVILLMGMKAARAADAVAPTRQDDFAASFLLRGGYDTNPEFSSGNGIGGSAFVGAETALIAGSKTENTTLGGRRRQVRFTTPIRKPPRPCAAR
jgi:hypothetical protein